MTAFEWLVEHTVIRGWSLFAVAVTLAVIGLVDGAVFWLALTAAKTCAHACGNPLLFYALALAVAGTIYTWVAVKIWRAAL